MAGKSKGDKVGKGHPPKHSQFKKGKSGNPAGRPKGSKNLKSLVDQLLGQKVPVVQNGQKKLIPMKQLLLTSLFSKASKGDVAALRLSLALIESSEQVNDAQGSPLTAADHKSLLAEIDWLAEAQVAHGEQADDEA